MARASKFSPEVRERSVRMVLENGGEHASRWAAVRSVAEKLGCLAETLRKWVERIERDQGKRPGLKTDEHAMKAIDNVVLGKRDDSVKEPVAVDSPFKRPLLSRIVSRSRWQGDGSPIPGRGSRGTGRAARAGGLRWRGEAGHVRASGDAPGPDRAHSSLTGPARLTPRTRTPPALSPSPPPAAGRAAEGRCTRGSSVPPRDPSRLR